MANAEEVYRESQERLHKTLGAYLLVKSWEVGVDCVAIPRSELLKFLQLERMKNKRIDWLKEDLIEFFPFQWFTVSSGTETYGTLYLSRFEFPSSGMEGAMTDEKRVTKFSDLGLKSQLVVVPPEKDIVVSMALLANGLLTPKNFGV